MGDEERLDWLTDMDLEILEFMSCRFILSPTIISVNIGRSREGVSNRLSALVAGGLISKLDRGRYRITDDGLDVVRRADTQEFERRRKEVTERKQIRYELGVSRGEYEKQVQQEHKRIKQEEPDCDDPLGRAFENVEERLREENE